MHEATASQKLDFVTTLVGIATAMINVVLCPINYLLPSSARHLL